MDIFDILKREYAVISRYISELEEMTYSVSVNTRDFSFLFRNLCRFWDQHEDKEEKLLRALSEAGFKIPLEKIEFEHGELRRHRDTVILAIESGDEDRIRRVLKKDCGEIIDMLRAHTIAAETLLADISPNDLSRETREKIELLQIIPSDEIFEDKE